MRWSGGVSGKQWIWELGVECSGFSCPGSEVAFVCVEFGK